MANVATTFEGLQRILDTTNPAAPSFTLVLTTSLAPIWGDVYFDGYNKTTNNGYGMIRNTNYDVDANQAFSLTGPVLAGYVPVPGEASTVPAPFFLLAGGLGGIGMIRRKFGTK
jgi:hypothetical protein